MGDPPTDGRPLDPRFDPDSAVLVLAPAMGRSGDGPCLELLAGPDARSANVLCLEYTRSAEAWLGDFAAYAGGPPAALALVRATGESPPIDEQPRRADGVVERTVDPSDLTTIGIAVASQLRGWAGSDRRTAVCVHSLTALLQYAETGLAYRFLHRLLAQLSSADAVTHLHMNPDAHDEQTVSLFSTLCDAVVEVDAGGGRRVIGRE